MRSHISSIMFPRARRALRAAFSAATNGDVIMLNGVKIAISRSQMSSKMLWVLRCGSYEQHEARQLPNIIQKGERIVELGGGIGYISALAALHPDTEAVSVYEANPGLIPVIERTHALNGASAGVFNAVVVPKKESPSIPFYVREDFWASSLSPAPYGFSDVINVPTIDFATMLELHNPTMLIVDIEGGEEMLFDDVPLTGIKKVLIELHQDVLGRSGMKKVFDFFSSRDFHYDQWHSSHGVVLFSHILR